MSLDSEQKNSMGTGTEQIVAVLSGEDALKERVRAWVMRAIAERDLDSAGVRQIIQEVFAGIGQGMPERGAQAGAAVQEAVQGLDEAVGKAVYAVQMAVEEAWGQGRQFTSQDLAETVDELRGLENDLLTSLKERADQGQGVAKEIFTGLYGHLSRNGTDTGNRFKAVAESLANRLGTAAHGGGADLKGQAEVGVQRLKSVASGILRGLADGLERRN